MLAAAEVVDKLELFFNYKPITLVVTCSLVNDCI